MSNTRPRIIGNKEVYWPQVIALLLLDVAVIISWIAYHEYQPKVLELFGFSKWNLWFYLWQGLIVVVTPAIAGWIADKQRNKTGKRLPIINIGVNVVAMIFMAVALTVFFEPTGPIKYLVPVFITAWLICMNLFRSPAISLIEQFVPQKYLPAVLALFVLSFDLAYALEPVIVQVLNMLGGPVTFVVGGILIFTTGFFLKKSFKKMDVKNLGDDFNNDTDDGKSRFGLVVILGVILGLYTTLIIKAIPDLINSHFTFEGSFLNGSWIGGLMLVIAAVFALIFGMRVNRANIQAYAVTGIIGFAILFGLLVSYPVEWMFYVSCGLVPVFFSMLSVSALPLALYELSTRQTVFGLGIFYGVSELADQGWNVLAELVA